MRMWITSQVGLEEPSAWGGLLTWLDIQIGDDDQDEDGLHSVCGRARVAIVHAGASGTTMWEVLDEESEELSALYARYFEGGWVKEEFEGIATDLMYVDELELDDAHKGRNIELAVVRRLCDTIGRGCAIVVVPYESDEQVELWQKMGFKVTEPGVTPGTMHLLSAFVQRTDGSRRCETGGLAIANRPSCTYVPPNDACGCATADSKSPRSRSPAPPPKRSSSRWWSAITTSTVRNSISAGASLTRRAFGTSLRARPSFRQRRRAHGPSRAPSSPGG